MKSNAVFIGAVAATRDQDLRCGECDGVIRLGIDLTIENETVWLCRDCARLIAHDIEKQCKNNTDFDSVYT